MKIKTQAQLRRERKAAEQFDVPTTLYHKDHAAFVESGFEHYPILVHNHEELAPLLAKGWHPDPKTAAAWSGDGGHGTPTGDPNTGEDAVDHSTDTDQTNDQDADGDADASTENDGGDADDVDETETESDDEDDYDIDESDDLDEEESDAVDDGSAEDTATGEGMPHTDPVKTRSQKKKKKKGRK